mmetsp:Transcript_87950/g.138842  ORF Transcript_87950/g.138842 Transcript_87950/m.138842 type:complete len:230 (+) Transcript_87950:54-743(+)
MRQSRSGPLLSTLSNVQGSPKWSMRGKVVGNRKAETPGPGAYNFSSAASTDGIGSKFKRSPNYGFGGASRDGYRPQSAPGPGQYDAIDPNTDSSAKYGFGTGARIGLKPRSEHPGPASYHLPEKVGNEGPKYSTVGRRNMGLSIQTPGPGAYSPDDNATSGYRSPTKWGFGKSPREGRNIGQSPGPGAYSQKDSIQDGPKYSMKGRNELFVRPQSPGPGEYGGVYTQFG